MTATSNLDTLARLDAMRAQEKTLRRVNYLAGATGDINEACRAAMVAWMTKAQRSLELGPDTVSIAMSFVDRYLGSGRDSAREMLASADRFQLLVVAAFYTAIKTYEPVAVGVDAMVQICRGAYRHDEIVAMEVEMLAALEWRVAIHTPMDVSRHLLDLLPPAQLASDDADDLLGLCQKHVDHAVTDIYFSCCTPTVVGISCLASAVVASDQLSPSAKQALWSSLSRACHFDLSPQEVTAARRQLISHTRPCPSSISRNGTTSRRVGRAKMSSERSITSISDLY